MRILWLTTVFDDSAVSNILLNILPYFPNDYKFFVVSVEKSQKFNSLALKKLQELNVQHISLGCKKKQILKSAKNLHKVLLSLSPDIVHAQLGRAYIALLLAKQTNSLYFKVATFHNNASYFNKLTSFFLKRFFYRFHAYTAVSRSSLESIQHTFDLEKRVKAQTIYNPIVTELQSTQKQELTNSDLPVPAEYVPPIFLPDQDETKLRLLFAGRLVHGKGIEHCLKMLVELNKILPQKPLLYFAGKGPLIKEIKSLCRKLKINNQVILLGYIKTLPQVIKKMDIVLFPSQNEGFGLVPCESLLLGIPIVAQDIPVMKEILSDEIWLTDCTNPKKFATKIADIQKNKNMYSDHIFKAQERIGTLFTPLRIAKEYRDFYDSLFVTKEKNQNPINESLLI